MLIKLNPAGKTEASPGYITSITLKNGEGEEITLTPDDNGNIEVDAQVATEYARTPRLTFVAN
jgi:hypothetical protein